MGAGLLTSFYVHSTCIRPMQISCNVTSRYVTHNACIVITFNSRSIMMSYINACILFATHLHKNMTSLLQSKNVRTAFVIVTHTRHRMHALVDEREQCLRSSRKRHVRGMSEVNECIARFTHIERRRLSGRTCSMWHGLVQNLRNGINNKCHWLRDI